MKTKQWKKRWLEYKNKKQQNVKKKKSFLLPIYEQEKRNRSKTAILRDDRVTHDSAD